MLVQLRLECVQLSFNTLQLVTTLFVRTTRRFITLQSTLFVVHRRASVDVVVHQLSQSVVLHLIDDRVECRVFSVVQHVERLDEQFNVVVDVLQVHDVLDLFNVVHVNHTFFARACSYEQLRTTHIFTLRNVSLIND